MITNVVGVDFSVRSRDAGEGMWVADATVSDDRVVVESVEPAADALGCDPDRDATLAALVGRIRDADERTAFGLDVPFGVAAADDPEPWTEWVREFPASVVAEPVSSTEELYRRYEAAGRSPTADAVRPTDADHGALSPLDWRMKDLTYHAVGAVLGPLVAADAATVVPMCEPAPGTPRVLETYPAAVFAGIDGASRDGYKGVRTGAYRTRRENVAALRDAGVELDPDAERRVSCHDDALDAVAAAYGVAQALEGDPALDAYDVRPTARGRIYPD